MDRDFPLAALLTASRRERLDLVADEWCDVLYLARHLGAARPADMPFPYGPADTEPGEPADERQPRPDLEKPPPTQAGTPPQPAERPAHGLGRHASLLYANRPHQERDQLALRVPTTPALSRTEFGKAFRGLKRTVDAPDDLELDVPVTVRQAADAGFWDPVLTPAPDRWLHVAVVVDDAASGPAWSDEIRAFLQALEDSGAFGGVRVWHFDSDAAEATPLTIRGGTAAAVAGRDNRELVDPSGRRAVLVLSDCVGDGWGDGRVASMIDVWAATNPVAVVHLLPQRFWSRCQPRLVSVDWQAHQPFTAGSAPRWRLRRDTASGAGSMVPVFDLTGAAMTRWATLVAGTSSGWIPGTAFCTKDGHLRQSMEAVDDDGEDDDLEHLEVAERSKVQVERFQAVASPPAFKLATLLSTAPLQAPTIRMIQRVALGTEQPTYWAEVLLSGLVDRVDGDGQDGILYDFADGVREQLLTRLTRGEALKMLRETSDFINSRLGGALDFLALLGLDEASPIGAADRPFARVAVQVLRALGGIYAEKAESLSGLLAADYSQREQNPSDTTRDYYPGLSTAEPRYGDPMTTANVAADPKIGLRGASRARIWDVPPRISHFTGRDTILEALRRELVENPNQAAVLVPRALFGLGGVGKTALANEYAYRYTGDYDVVWWIPAEDPADIRRSLVQLSRELQLPEYNDQAETIRRLLLALTEGRPKTRWLIIYDNASQPADLDGLVPATTRFGHVLITSRDPSWQQRGRMLQVDAFTRSESTALLRRRAPQITDDEADRLAELLEDLPLALNQAAAWHEETKLSTVEYLRQYEEKHSLLPAASLLPEYPRAVGATFGVSYEHLRSKSVAAAQLLQLCSHFGPEAISVDMFWRGRYAPDIPMPLRSRMLDRTWLRRELKNISRYELIQLDQGRDRFQLHRLVQRILRGTVAIGEQDATPRHAQSILAHANPGNPDEVDLQSLGKHAELSPHLLPSGIIESTDPEARKVVLDQVRYRYMVGDYQGGRDLARLTIEEWERQFGPDDVQLLLAKRHLAATLRVSGEPEEALQLAERVLARFRALLGYDHEHTLATADSYAASLRAMGRFREALETDRDNLQRYRSTLRGDDPESLRAANNNAVDLRLLGDFQGALAIDEQNLAMWTSTLGPDRPETLFALSNLVRDLYALGRYGEALTLQEDALPTFEAAVGPTHPNVLMARRSVAMLLRKLGRHRQARERAEETFAAYVARFAENHEHTLAAMMSLANALRDEDRDSESRNRARQLCERALVLYHQSFPEHPFYYVCQTNLAITLRASGEVAEARRLNIEAEGRLRELLGEGHPYRLCAATNLASDLARSSNYEAACRLSAEILETSRRNEVRGDDHPYTLGCALNHALDLQSVGRGDEAADLWNWTRGRLVAVLGPDHPDTLQARERRRIEADIEPPPT